MNTILILILISLIVIIGILIERLIISYNIIKATNEAIEILAKKLELLELKLKEIKDFKESVDNKQLQILNDIYTIIKYDSDNKK